jgi:hypothetical protein
MEKEKEKEEEKEEWRDGFGVKIHVILAIM